MESTETSVRSISSSSSSSSFIGSSGAFVEAVDPSEISVLKAVGQGAFGVVHHARWRGFDVAVKVIHNEQERRAFQAEVRQLSRVSHPNIVRLYGAGTHLDGSMLLLMEYAEGGSLYNVLHGETPQGYRAEYTTAHAISWALQTARGVAYLHAMTPKPVVHRDLKPPNLLLVDAGRVLKICDFGTACECQTFMTNAKGSAAWMAPEVFRGSVYTEKCDIFSWGIILWEVLTRMKPFDDIGGSAYRIMWAVQSGNRPALIHNCPEPIEALMTSCWDAEPSNRPPMDEIVRILTDLQRFFPGHDAPLEYSAPDGMTIDSTYETDYSTGCDHQSVSWGAASSGRFSAFPGSSEDMKREEAKFLSRLASREEPGFVGFGPRLGALHVDVESTRENDLPSNAIFAGKEDDCVHLSAPLQQPGHQKRHSADLSRIFPEGLPAVAPPKPTNFQQGRALGHRRASSYGNGSPAITTGGCPNSGWPSWVRPVPTQPITAAAYDLPLATSGDNSFTGGFIDEAYLMLPQDLFPIGPDDTIPESVAVFEDHRRLAMDYVRVNAEISLLESSISELRRELKEEEEHSKILNVQGQESLMKEYQKMLEEKDSFESLYKCLQTQLEAARTGMSQP